MSRRHLRSCCSALALLALAACASAPSGNSGIAIQATVGGQYVAGANCSVTTVDGSRRVVTPASIPIPSAGDIGVVCDLPGYRRSEVIYRAPPAGFAGGSQVGIGIGGGSGGVGIGLGMGVPIGGGARPAYPSQLNVELTPAR